MTPIGLVGPLVFVAGGKTAADAHFEFDLELLLLVERADELVRIDHFDALVELGCRRRSPRLPCSRRAKACALRDRRALNLTFFRLRTMSVTSSTTPGKRGEFVHRAVDLDRGDGGAFERGEQHAAERVADGVAVTGFKRLGDELGVGFSGASSRL